MASPPYVDLKSAKKIKNDVNIHKDTSLMITTWILTWFLLIFTLLLMAEASLPSFSAGADLDQFPPPMSPHAQIAQAVLEQNKGHFEVKVIKQILWIEGIHYKLHEIYRNESSSEQGFDDSDSGKECVICMTEPKDTAVLLCRHMNQPKPAV
ncbi:hypothetical protein REPUB_Repub16aG0134100 [Reevesia pubescens]